MNNNNQSQNKTLSSKNNFEKQDEHFLIRLLAYLEMISMFVVLILRSVFFSVILLFVMFLFETAGLSFLFKDFFLVKMININISMFYKYALSFAFSALAAFFVIGVILYTKLHEIPKDREEDKESKFKGAKGINTRVISICLGVVIFIGYIKGYPFSGVDIHGKSVIRNLNFWFDFALHGISGLGISFFSVYVNYLIADKIKSLQAAGSLSVMATAYKSKIASIIQNGKVTKRKSKRVAKRIKMKEIPKVS